MLQQTIRSWIDQLLVYIGISADSARGIDQWVILAIIVAIGVGLDFLIRLLLLQVVRRVVKQTKVTWDDIIFDDKVLRRLCHIVTPILVVVMLPIAFPDQNGLVVLITRLVQIAIVIAVLRFVNSLLEAIFQLMGRREEWKGKPLKGLMQTGQVIAFLVAVILVFSILLDRSPAMFLTGLGASAAIFMLVFRDSILGFVSGIQLSANNMLKVGDWISMPKYGADGTVEEVTLNTAELGQYDRYAAALPAGERLVPKLGRNAFLGRAPRQALDQYRHDQHPFLHTRNAGAIQAHRPAERLHRPDPAAGRGV